MMPSSSNPKKGHDAARLFTWMIVTYFMANFLLRVLLPNSLELDEAQQIFLAQWIAPGYGTQPPFYNWVQYGVIALFGPSVFSLSLLKNVTLLLSYLLYFATARLVLKRTELAAVAALGMLTLPQISFQAQRDLTHTVAAVFAACFFLFCLIRTIEKPNALGYGLTGLAIGIGTLSKYNFVILPTAALLVMLWDRDMRARVFDPRIALTAIVAAVVAAPHAIWLFAHMSAPTQGTIERMAGDGLESYPQQVGMGLLSLVSAFLEFSFVTVILFLAAFPKELVASWSAKTRWTTFFERLMLVFALLIVIVIVSSGAGRIKARWLTPFMLVLPLYLCLKIEAAGLARTRMLRRFLPIAIAIMVIIPTILGVRVFAAGVFRHYEKLNVPFAAFAKEIMRGGQPVAIAAGGETLAGNLRLQFPDIPVLAPHEYPQMAPSFEATSSRPVVLVWYDAAQDATIPDVLQDWLKKQHPDLQVGDVNTVALPYNYGAAGDKDIFHYVRAMPAVAR